MKTILFSLLFIIWGVFVHACSCGPMPKLTKKGVNQSSEIFVGTIIDVTIDLTARSKTATFIVDKHLKSKSKSDTLKVITSSDGGMCGLYFQKGQRWYIFSSGDKENLYAGLCGRSLWLKKTPSKTKFWSKHWWSNTKYYRSKKKRYRRDKRVIRRATRWKN